MTGGSGVVATELGLQLAKRGHEIHFVSYAMPFRLEIYQPNVYYHGVQTTAYPLFQNPPYTLTLASKMADVTKNYSLELLHVHYAIPHAASAYLAREILKMNGERVPKVITTLHGTDITLVGADASFYDITRFSINASDGVTAVSQYLADETMQVFTPQKQVEVIHNFFDGARFRPSTQECQRGQFVSRDEFLLMHVSNFRTVKRPLDVVDIFDKVNQKLPSKLLLIGEGPEMTLTRRQVTKKGLSDRVIYLGNQSKVEAVLPCADMFLMPSEEESFGLAALEALACGVPVVGTSATGLAEVIEHEVNGFLLPVGDTQAMADATIQLLSDKARHRKFKEAAASRATERFGAEKIVGQYERFYERIVRG